MPADDELLEWSWSGSGRWRFAGTGEPPLLFAAGDADTVILDAAPERQREVDRPLGFGGGFRRGRGWRSPWVLYLAAQGSLVCHTDVPCGVRAVGFGRRRDVRLAA